MNVVQGTVAPANEKVIKPTDFEHIRRSLKL
jgi:hypothetical protein